MTYIRCWILKMERWFGVCLFLGLVSMVTTQDFCSSIPIQSCSPLDRVLIWSYSGQSQTCGMISVCTSQLGTNTHNSLADCHRNCICNQPHDSGRSFCRARHIRWYWDTVTRSCRRFIFGGCFANTANNFRTRSDCELICREGTFINFLRPFIRERPIAFNS